MQPDKKENRIREITPDLLTYKRNEYAHKPGNKMIRLSCQQVVAAQLQPAVAGRSWGVCGTALCEAQVGGSHNVPTHVTAELRFHAIQPISKTQINVSFLINFKAVVAQG